MFYYGLDFHDLALNSFLYISVFIVVCEGLLRIPPHFGLWLKVFNMHNWNLLICRPPARCRQLADDKERRRPAPAAQGDFFTVFCVLGLGFSGRIRLLPDLGLDS